MTLRVIDERPFEVAVVLKSSEDSRRRIGCKKLFQIGGCDEVKAAATFNGNEAGVSPCERAGSEFGVNGDLPGEREGGREGEDLTFRDMAVDLRAESLGAIGKPVRSISNLDNRSVVAHTEHDTYE